MQETCFIKENQKVLDLLRKIDKLQMFSDDDLHSFLDLGKLRKYEAGEMIIHEGEYDSWIYFLLTGQVDIFKQNKQVDSLNRSGDLFGEMGIVDGSARSASVKAATGTLVLGVDGSLIDREEVANHAAFCYTIYRLFAEVLAERLRITTEENIRLRGKVQDEKSSPAATN